MDIITNGLASEGKILGIPWAEFWTTFGWLANGIFFSRFIVQWYATEKRKQVTVPALFWWLSLAGSVMLLLYAVFYDKHHVFIFAYAFSWIPYIRNLVIHQRHQLAEKKCAICPEICSPKANYCPNCGVKRA